MNAKEPVTVPAAPASRHSSAAGFANIVRIVIWPLLILALAVLYRDKVVPSKVVLDSKAVKLTIDLLQATQQKDGSNANASASTDVVQIARAAQNAAAVSLQGKKVLWVDDNPARNAYERSALEQLGIAFITATNTAEAEALLRERSFDLVITDFARRDDPKGGYALLGLVKGLNPKLPVIIYSSSGNPKHEAEAKSNGAFAETNQPQVLFNAAIQALQRAS